MLIGLHLLDRVNRVALTTWLQAPERVIHLICRVSVVIIRVDDHLALCLLYVTVLFLAVPLSFFLDLLVPLLSEANILIGLVQISGSWLFPEFLSLLSDAFDDFLPSRSFDLMLPILYGVHGSILHLKLELGLRVQIP